MRPLTFDVLSHVVVKDHGDVLDIDTSTSNVCGHQNIFGSRLEVGKGKLSLLLAFATVQCAGVVLQGGGGDEEVRVKFSCIFLVF